MIICFQQLWSQKANECCKFNRVLMEMYGLQYKEIIMSVQQRRQNSDPLCYRLYIVCFEGSKSILKNIRKDAFYRLSIWHDDSQIAEMVKGVNPVVLADKIFLGNALINFEQPPTNDQVTLKLQYHYEHEDSTLAESTVDLSNIIQDFLRNNVKYHPQLTTTFILEEEELKLVFNIFVDKTKKELDSLIRKQKQQQKELLRIKRESSSKEREKSKITRYNEIVILERRNSVTSEFRFDLGGGPQKKDSQSGLNKPETVESQIKIQEQQSSENIPEDDKIYKLPSLSTPKSYLEINSAAKFHPKTDKYNRNIDKVKSILVEMDEKDNKSMSSKMSSFHNSPRKPLSFNAEGASIISDGSEASEMLANNLSQSYSQRAIAKFKQNMFRCVNIIIIILAIVLLYFLFIPRVKFTKLQRPKRGRNAKASEGFLEI